MPKYDVHLRYCVRVKVANVEAETQGEAVLKAKDVPDLRYLFDRTYCRCQEGPDPWQSPHVEYTEHDDELDDDPFDEVLVDVVGDKEYEQSAWFDLAGQPLRPDAPGR